MKTQPEAINVDGIKCGNNVELWGIAVLLPSGKYVCLAVVEGCLCIIEITIHLKSEMN